MHFWNIVRLYLHLSNAVDDGMDFESGSTAYPSMMHSAHGRRDVPFAPVNPVKQ
jgi:hypothetical protein